MATILIVDDEEPFREFLSELLEEAGYRILQAINGAQALTVTAHDRPDLVIADVMMPVLGGVALCRRLKAQPDTRAIPVILMSGAGERAAAGASADAFIDKPFVLEEMEALVRHWLPPAQPEAGSCANP